MLKRNGLKVKVNQGIGLIEVMVTAFILAVGLLAVVAMQGIAKRSSYEAQQRTYAMLMAESMVERIHLNRSAWSAQFGATNQIDSDDALERGCADSNGLLSGCNAVELVETDLYLWNEYMRQNNLQGYSGCVILDADGGLQVIVSWASRVSLGDETASVDDTCQVTGNSRRSVMITSRVVS